MQYLSKIKILVLSVLLLFSCSTCRKDSFRFPYTTINASIGLYSDLGDLALGFAKIFPRTRFGGVGGLIVYRSVDDDYFVYDAACTYDYEDGCTVAPDASFNELMVCSCCKSSYLLSSEANVFNPPAVHPLVEYKSFIDGGFLRVVN
jgi:Rieske Fe-S protein